jgi:radical SAM protein with 4Fe4S-binding SPASM domain
MPSWLEEKACDYLLGEAGPCVPIACENKTRDELDGGGVVFNRKTLKLAKLDALGFGLFCAVDGKKTVREIVSHAARKRKMSLAYCSALALANFKGLLDASFITAEGFPKIPLRVPNVKGVSRFSAPNQAAWLITSQCNLRCSHCGNASRSKLEGELSHAEGMALIKYLADAGVFILDISGGEPMIRPDALELFAYARSLGMEMGMTTNGTLIDEKKALALKKIGMYNIHVSIDGIGKVHDGFRNVPGTFAKARNTIRLFKKHKVPFGITTAVCKLNFAGLGDVRKFVEKEGITSWEIYYAIPVGCMGKSIALDEKEALLLARKIEGYRRELAGRCDIFVGDSLGHYGSARLRGEDWMGCQAGIGMVAIDPEGNIKGCPIHPNCLIEGNIRKDDLLSIWRSDDHFAYNRKPQKLEKHCASCPEKAKCRGGCRTLTFALTGGFACNPMCLRHLEAAVEK